MTTFFHSGLSVGEVSEPVVVTGAFSYTGKYVTRLLLSRRYKVRTLTYHTKRENPFGEKVQAFPYSFDNPERLTETLRGASTLINTYWVRFPRGTSTFETAVQNTCADLPPGSAHEIIRRLSLPSS